MTLETDPPPLVELPPPPEDEPEEQAFTFQRSDLVQERGGGKEQGGVEERV
jgi:hypothetical protein